MMPGRSLSGKTRRPFDRAGRQHDAAGADVPQALARQSGGRRRPEPLADPFGGDQVVVVVIAEHRRLAAAAVLPASRRVRRPRRAPIPCRRPRRSAPDGSSSPPPNSVSLSARITLRAAPTRTQRRAQPGRPAADHQHVAMRVTLVVARRVRQFRRPPEPGHTAQQRLPERHPRAPRSCAGPMKVL